MPGRSITVKSGTSGDFRSMRMLCTASKVAPGRPLPAKRNSVRHSIFGPISSGLDTGPASAGWGLSQDSDKWADHGSPLGIRCIRSSVAHLVTRPAPRGNGTPLRDSSTEDLPEDWSPMTAAETAEHGAREAQYPEGSMQHASDLDATDKWRRPIAMRLRCDAVRTARRPTALHGRRFTSKRTAEIQVPIPWYSLLHTLAIARRMGSPHDAKTRSANGKGTVRFARGL
mmetsp:Transcript_16435/g.42120  ORF Transcript_16435/g.42120 Transcript_16435/m.42120 type:complete len:228 (+) Transcript_16435:599-1282(+)